MVTKIAWSYLIRARKLDQEAVLWSILRNCSMESNCRREAYLQWTQFRRFSNAG